MSEAFVDVTWRGLEVGKRVKLHAIHPGDAYIDHSTPMPVGTVLQLKTDEGLEIAATVTRVHEQVGGTNEVPGMQVKPTLAGAAAAWWKERAEAAPPPPVTPVTPVTPVAVAPLSPATLAAADDPRASIVAKPTLTMTTVEVERAMAAVKGEVAEDLDAGSTEVMAAVDPALLEAIAVEERSDPNLVDDGKRTMVMSAVDVNAIVEAAEADADVSGGVNGNGTGEEPSSDDAGASGSRGSGSGSGSGKKKRGKGKRRG
ncbi:MAG TPA: hypothetical protein VM261_13215 [Kofleriaceae bacterium]|nr:hypothetical protein [Kofleriaceae bacterium]